MVLGVKGLGLTFLGLACLGVGGCFGFWVFSLCGIVGFGIGIWDVVLSFVVCGVWVGFAFFFHFQFVFGVLV